MTFVTSLATLLLCVPPPGLTATKSVRVGASHVTSPPFPTTGDLVPTIALPAVAVAGIKPDLGMVVLVHLLLVGSQVVLRFALSKLLSCTIGL